MTTTKHLIVSWFCVCYDCAVSGYDHRKAQDLKPPLALGHTLFHQIQIPAEDQCSNSDPLISLLCLLSRILSGLPLPLPLAGEALVREIRSPLLLYQGPAGLWVRECLGREEKRNKGERAWDRVKMCTDGVKWRHTIRKKLESVTNILMKKKIESDN